MTTQSPGLCAECTGRRDQWFDAISTRILNNYVTSADPLPEALLRLTAACGHLLGARDEEIIVDGLGADTLRNEIRHWRSGRVHPRIAWNSFLAWASLFVYGRESGRLPQPVAKELERGPVGRSMPLMIKARSHASISCQHSDRLFERSPGGALDLGENHLIRVLAHLVEHDLDDANQVFTPLEVSAAYPDGDEDLELDAWIDMCGRAVDASLVASWSGSTADGLTEYHKESVITHGARNMHQSTGVVPGWFATTETTRDLVEMRRLRYGYGVGVSVEGDTLRLRLTPPPDNGTRSDLALDFKYVGSDVMSLARLASLVAMRSGVLDLLHLDGRRKVRHEGVFRIQLPEEPLDRMREFVRANFIDGSEAGFWESLLAGNQDTAEPRAQAAEMRRFELARLVRTSRNEPANAPLTQALTTYLSALERVNSLSVDPTALDPQMVDLEETSFLLRQTVAGRQLHLGSVEPPDLKVLGARRAIVHLEIAAGYLLAPIASWLDVNGRAHYRHFDGGVWNSATTAGLPASDQVRLLVESLKPLAELQALGVDDVVLCPAERLAHLPVHEAFLTLGFAQASYAPSLALLQSPTRTNHAPQPMPFVSGSAGAGKGFLPGVEAELTAISRLYRTQRSGNAPESGAYQLIHLAGHATVGLNEATTGIHLADGILSSARVLRDLDLSGTDLVVLAACGTGQTYHGDGEVFEHLPLDGCFITAGARCVVSTSQPIGDRAALLFSTLFHEQLLDGSATWDAYEVSRRHVRTPSRVGVSPAIQDLLDTLMPEWDTTPFQNNEKDDWLKFRISGRHW